MTMANFAISEGWRLRLSGPSGMENQRRELFRSSPTTSTAASSARARPTTARATQRRFSQPYGIRDPRYMAARAVGTKIICLVKYQVS